MYFCKEDEKLFLLEVMMRQVPGFRPRRNGLRVSQKNLTMDELFGEDGKDAMKIRMETYEVPGRMKRDAEERSTGDELFKDEAHKKRFLNVMAGPCERQMTKNGRFLAATFLLTADEWLWSRAEGCVTEIGIFFDNASISGAGTDQYVLFHSAKELYTGEQFVSMEEMADSEIVSDELLSLIVSAYLLRVAGIGLAKEVRSGE